MAINTQFGCAATPSVRFSRNLNPAVPHFAGNSPIKNNGDRFEPSTRSTGDTAPYAPGLKGKLQYYRDRAQLLAANANNPATENAALLLALVLAKLAG